MLINDIYMRAWVNRYHCLGLECLIKVHVVKDWSLASHYWEVVEILKSRLKDKYGEVCL
jgi:hypothetical protein